MSYDPCKKMKIKIFTGRDRILAVSKKITKGNPSGWEEATPDGNSHSQEEMKW